VSCQQEGELTYEEIHRLLLRNPSTGGPKVEVKDEKAKVQQVRQQNEPAMQQQPQTRDFICVIEQTESIKLEVYIDVAGPPDIVTSTRCDTVDLESGEVTRQDHQTETCRMMVKLSDQEQHLETCRMMVKLTDQEQHLETCRMVVQRPRQARLAFQCKKISGRGDAVATPPQLPPSQY